MVTVGVLSSFEVKLGLEQDVADFFQEGLPLVEAQPSTTVWFAFRLGETTYGAFAAFADAADRDALLASGGPQLSRKYAHLFTQAPSFDKVDVLQARL
jgi:hypothetical protein